jgi:hypothetical protein
MNMNHNPTRAELKRLFAGADDDAGHHVLWVDRAGEVHISVVPDHLTPIGFASATPTMKMRHETLGR